MKIVVSKIDAARWQLLEAIRLFFEERDPISIHTLVGASLQILHDHIDDIGVVWDNNLMFHYHSIYIKDEHRKEWKNKINEAQNLFKHAERDLQKGRPSIEFETDITAFHILEAVRCLRIVEGDSFQFSPEFKVFWAWYGLKYPKHLKEGAREAFKKMSDLDPDDLSEFSRVIDAMHAKPSEQP